MIIICHITVNVFLIHLFIFIGEMSESQKQEIERNKELLAQREGAMTEAHQQMAKLSKIIDKQKDEIRALEEELR